MWIVLTIVHAAHVSLTIDNASTEYIRKQPQENKSIFPPLSFTTNFCSAIFIRNIDHENIVSILMESRILLKQNSRNNKSKSLFQNKINRFCCGLYRTVVVCSMRTENTERKGISSKVCLNFNAIGNRFSNYLFHFEEFIYFLSMSNSLLLRLNFQSIFQQKCLLLHSMEDERAYFEILFRILYIYMKDTYIHTYMGVSYSFLIVFDVHKSLCSYISTNKCAAGDC